MKHTTSLILFLISSFCLVGAFTYPFFSIALDTDVPASVSMGKDLIFQGKSTPIIGNQITELTNSFFGDKLFDEACEKDWKPCFQSWLADQIGITRGDQYLLDIIQKMFTQREIFLGILLFSFSVLFPISKNILGLICTICSPKSKKKYYVWLNKTGKWSMTDVFVVALLIVFFKADNIHLYMEAKTGVYLFACAALFSSLGAMRLGSELGAQLCFHPPSSSNRQ